MRALVLEPDRTVRAWLEAGLRSRGHAVVSRSAADEAWTAYERQQPMVALLDWAGEDGAEVCRRIRAGANGDRCVVLATGLSDRPGDVKDALDVGADDYLPKMADAGVLEGRLAVAERRVRQIEERSAAEEALKESERRYRSVVEAARDVIATLSSDGSIISVNAAFEAMTGWRPAEWIGRGFERLVHPEDVSVAHAMIERALRGEVHQPAEVRVLSRAGDWRIVECSATGQELNGHAATVLATARDVTEHKREQRRETTRHVATRVLGDAPSLSEGASALLQALCVGLGWEVGLLWTADRDGQQLCFESLWHLPVVDASDLLSASRAARPRPGEGPVGEAWRSAAAVWTVDGSGHGLRAGVAVPIRCGAEVVGVLQLLSAEPRPLDHLALRTAEEIAAEIGNLFARRQAEEALRESEQRYALAVRGANDGIWDWNLRTAQAYYSPRCKTILGFEEEEVGAWPEAWLPRVHPDDAPRVRERIAAHLEGHSPHFEDEHRVRQSDGSYRWVHCRGLALRDAKLRVCRMAGAITDINDRRAHDPLTSLPNRALFVERLGRALVRARRQKDTLFAVLFIDLDRFKAVNDSLGHLAGDQVLIAVARRLEACMRPSDVVGRFGGDEFAVLLEPIKRVGDATRVAERIQQALAAPLDHGGHELFTAASIGIALSTTGYERPEEILRDADTAMYQAKAAGKARHEVFHEGMRERAAASLATEASPFAASA